MIKSEDIRIQLPVLQGKPLTEIVATVYTPLQDLAGAVMIAPGTGVKRKFYTPFASYLTENGYAVITYDNQGIGDSLVGKTKDCEVSLQDWGYQDQTEVLEYLKKAFPDVQYHLVGHSAGGQLVGLMHNWKTLSSMFNVGCSSGSIRNLSYPFKFRALYFMKFFIRVNNLLLGYTRTDWVGLGEPLPKKVAAQWSSWCSGQGYVKTAFGKTISQHWYDEVDLPSIWLNAPDDEIANDANVDDMIAVHTKLKPERLKLEPSAYGLKEIGHMKFFSRKSKVLWPIALDWLVKQTVK